MGRRRLSGCVAFATCSALSRIAAASPLPARLELVLTSCESSGIEAREAERTVRSELEADGVAQVVTAGASEPSDAWLAVDVGCDAALTAHLELKSQHTGRERARSIALADADPSARTRALGLAVAELVRSDWPELNAPEPSTSTNASAAYPDAHPATDSAANNAANGTKRAPVTPTRANAGAAPESNASASRGDAGAGSATRSDPERAHTLAFAASARMRWFVDYASVSWGGELGPDFGPFRVRGEALVSAKQDALGSANLGSAALCLGYRVLDVRVGAFALSGFPLASAGVTWLRGSPAPGVHLDPSTGFYGDLRFLLEARLRAARLGPTLALEVGRASGLVARGADRTLGATGGFFLGASAGFRY